jgi:hypothetical protein
MYLTAMIQDNLQTAGLIFLCYLYNTHTNNSRSSVLEAGKKFHLYEFKKS